MSGIFHMLLGGSGGGALQVVSDGSFSGAPLAATPFAG